MSKVFVSYARDESPKVYRILGKLKTHGIDFWVDTVDIKNGKDWAEEISKAIKKCSKFLLFMSKLSMASDNTSREVKIAYGNHKKFVLLRLDDVELPNKFKYALEGIQWTDYSSRKWKSEIISVLGGKQKFFRKPKPSTNRLAPSTKSLPKRPLKTQLIIAKLESTFSTNRTYYPDQCVVALSKLNDLRLVAGSHWINPALAYDEFVPRQYLLDKIEVIQNLIQDFQDTCPPGLSSKRQLIQNEIKTLSQELSRKTNR